MYIYTHIYHVSVYKIGSKSAEIIENASAVVYKLEIDLISSI